VKTAQLPFAESARLVVAPFAAAPPRPPLSSVVVPCARSTRKAPSRPSVFAATRFFAVDVYATCVPSCDSVAARTSSSGWAPPAPGDTHVVVPAARSRRWSAWWVPEAPSPMLEASVSISTRRPSPERSSTQADWFAFAPFAPFAREASTVRPVARLRTCTSRVASTSPSPRFDAALENATTVPSSLIAARLE